MIDFNVNEIIDNNLEGAIIKISGELDAMRQGDYDIGAIFEPELIDAITLIYECDSAQYQRLRHELKNFIPITALEKLIHVGADSRKERHSPADDLVNLVKVDLELFHDDGNTTYATVNVKGHFETYQIYSNSFSDWLASRYYQQTKNCLTDLTIKTAQQALSARARFEGIEINPFLRVANHENGYVLDIGDSAWKSIIVKPNHWEIVENSPVKFWRNETMKPLPIPQSGGLKYLKPLLNIPNGSYIFILAFIFESWRNDTMFPILELVGEQGSAKSFTQSVLREFIDPNKVPLRAAPKNVEDLFVSASQNWLASYNNLSYLNSNMQDALCSLSTGGGHSSRKLYTNNEESVIDVSRPCIVNGIGGVATSQDLLDRVIRIELPSIKSNIPISVLNDILASKQSEIFGGLLDLFSKVLHNLPKVNKKSINDRMADFILLGEAIYLSIGKKPIFAKKYKRMKHRAATHAIEASPAILSVIRIVEKFPYSGSYEKLYRRLKSCYPSFDLPRSPKGLADLLRRQTPALKQIGIRVLPDPVRKNDGYHVSIKKITLGFKVH